MKIRAGPGFFCAMNKKQKISVYGSEVLYNIVLELNFRFEQSKEDGVWKAYLRLRI